MTNNDSTTFLVSEGHAEYPMPTNVAGLDVTEVWPPAAMSDEERDGLYDLYGSDQVDVWERYNPGTLPPDADLAWEHIISVTGTPEAINAGLDLLIADISTRPSGDDDVFDYWPSGCRLALDVAAQVDRTDEVTAVIRSVIVTSLEDYAEELFDKVGIDSGEDV